VGREVRLDEGHLTAVDRVHVDGVDVHPDHVHAVGRQNRSGGQADVPQTDHRNRLGLVHPTLPQQKMCPWLRPKNSTRELARSSEEVTSQVWAIPLSFLTWTKLNLSAA